MSDVELTSDEVYFKLRDWWEAKFADRPIYPLEAAVHSWILRTVRNVLRGSPDPDKDRAMKLLGVFSVEIRGEDNAIDEWLDSFIQENS